MVKIFNKALEIAWGLYPDTFGEARCHHVSCLFDKTKLLCVGQNSPNTHARNIFNNVRRDDLGVKATCSEMKMFIAKNRFSNLNWKRLVMVNPAGIWKGPVFTRLRWSAE